MQHTVALPFTIPKDRAFDVKIASVVGLCDVSTESLISFAYACHLDALRREHIALYLAPRWALL